MTVTAYGRRLTAHGEEDAARAGQTCPGCGAELTEHRIVSGPKLIELDMRGEGIFFSCPGCGEFWNKCLRHGLFSAEAHGARCPGCAEA